MQLKCKQAYQHNQGDTQCPLTAHSPQDEPIYAKLGSRVERTVLPKYPSRLILGTRPLTEREIDRHVKLVRRWLEKHVHKANALRGVRLHSFVADWEELRGSFKVDFDDVPCPMAFTYSVGGADGHTAVHAPIFTSPLGAPASYDAVEANKEAWDAIYRGIETLFPPIKPLGRDPETGKIIDTTTPLSRRILDEAALASTRAKMSALEFFLECKIE